MAGSTSNESRPQELLKDLDDGFFLISIQVFSTKSLREAKRLYYILRPIWCLKKVTMMLGRFFLLSSRITFLLGRRYLVDVMCYYFLLTLGIETGLAHMIRGLEETMTSRLL